MRNPLDSCEECYKCVFFVVNNDGDNCNGGDKPCEQYIQVEVKDNGKEKHKAQG